MYHMNLRFGTWSTPPQKNNPKLYFLKFLYFLLCGPFSERLPRTRKSAAQKNYFNYLCFQLRGHENNPPPLPNFSVTCKVSIAPRLQNHWCEIYRWEENYSRLDAQPQQTAATLAHKVHVAPRLMASIATRKIYCLTVSSCRTELLAMKEEWNNKLIPWIHSAVIVSAFRNQMCPPSKCKTSSLQGIFSLLYIEGGVEILEKLSIPA